MPDWIQKGFEEYARRLPRENALELVEVPVPKRASNNVDVQLRKEEKLLLAKLQPREFVIALDERGKAWSSQSLAERMNQWRQSGSNVALLVGGPDGLSDGCKNAAGEIWSLSVATLPHTLVRVIIAEQIYRAWSLNMGHPYHRA